MDSTVGTKLDSAEWIRACKLKSMREDEGVRVQMPGGGKKDAVALFLHDRKLFALEDRCCHSDKSLHGGDIEDLGECIVGAQAERGVGGLCVQCPRHQRKFAGGLYFNLETGEARTPEYTSKFRKLDSHHVRVYDVRIDSGVVYISQRPRDRPRQVTRLAHAELESVDVREEQEDCQSRKRPCAQAEHCTPTTLFQPQGENVSLTLHSIERASHDSVVFVLHQVAGSPFPQAPESSIWHVSIYAKIRGEVVEREYTPVSDWSEWLDLRRVRLLVKIYPDGLMTQYLASLSIGDQVVTSAPQSTLLLPALLPPKELSTASTSFRDLPPHTILVAAGTGIVPMIQILSVLMQAKASVRSVTLLYGCRSGRDLLCWSELCALTQSIGDERLPQVRIWLAFSEMAPQSTHLEGCTVTGIMNRRVDHEVLQEALLPLQQGTQIRVIVSGPDGFFATVGAALPRCVNVTVDALVDLDS